MKITILTVGSRGDIEPFVALGEGLQAAGHVVTIATEQRFENFVKGRKLNFAAVPGDTHAALNSEACMHALNRKNNTEIFFKILTEATAPFAQQTILQNLQACKGAEHIITTPWCLHTGYFIAQQLSVPMSVVSGNATVLSDTRYFQNLMFPIPADWWPGLLNRVYNALSHRAVEGQWWKSYQKIYGEAWRQVTGYALPKQDPITLWANKKPLLLYGYSNYVLPKPKDWRENQHVTGYWLLKNNGQWKPEAALENFIGAGPAPIYIGFGSMNNSLLKADSLEKMIFEVIEKMGQRAVVLKQGLNLGGMEIPHNVFVTEPVPFDYLFPKMSLLVHHAGAGTTALGLKSGVPGVFTPLIVDQRFWAWRAYKCGVAAEPLPWYDLKADNLASAIKKAIADEGMRTRASQLGKRINEEHGVEQAVSIFNRWIDKD